MRIPSGGSPRPRPRCTACDTPRRCSRPHLSQGQSRTIDVDDAVTADGGWLSAPETLELIAPAPLRLTAFWPSNGTSGVSPDADPTFRFSEPVTFNGEFTAGTPLRMTYHILGATELNGANALLVEPMKIEAAR